MSKKPKKKRIKNIRTNHDHVFTEEFIRSLANWQRGWYGDQDKRRTFADELIAHCENLPIQFRYVNRPCYRKRFLIEGEVVPIILNGELHEGIASWSLEMEFTKKFRGLYRRNTKFAILFKHTPEQSEVIVNLVKLWKNKSFTDAVEKFSNQHPKEAEPLLRYKDTQSEVILKSTLKGIEIEDIVTMSRAFDELCDMANIPAEKRAAIREQYDKNAAAIPIHTNVFAGRKTTKASINNSIRKIKIIIEDATKNGVPIIWPQNLVHKEDLKHHLRD